MSSQRARHAPLPGLTTHTPPHPPSPASDLMQHSELESVPPPLFDHHCCDCEQRCLLKVQSVRLGLRMSTSIMKDRKFLGLTSDGQMKILHVSLMLTHPLILYAALSHTNKLRSVSGQQSFI